MAISNTTISCWHYWGYCAIQNWWRFRDLMNPNLSRHLTLKI